MATATLDIPTGSKARVRLRNDCYQVGQRLDAAQARVQEASVDVLDALAPLKAIDPELEERLRAACGTLTAVAQELTMAVNVMDTHRLIVEADL